MALVLGGQESERLDQRLSSHLVAASGGTQFPSISALMEFGLIYTRIVIELHVRCHTRLVTERLEQTLEITSSIWKM